MIGTQCDTAVLHACYHAGSICLWAESASRFLTRPGEPGAGVHPFAASGEELAACLPGMGGLATRPIVLRLPAMSGQESRIPLPSEPLAHELGREIAEPDQTLALGAFRVEAAEVPYGRYREILEGVLDRSERDEGRLACAESIRFAALLGLLAHHLMAQHRFVPMLFQEDRELRAGWMPWLGDAATGERVRAIAGLMPPSVRAPSDEHDQTAWTIVQRVLGGVVDAACRKTLIDEAMVDTIEGRGVEDVQVAWLRGLLGAETGVPAGEAARTEMPRRVRRWVGSLEDRGRSSSWRLLLRLNEPLEELVAGVEGPPPESVRWSLSLHLQNQDDPGVVVDAVDVWGLSRSSVSVRGLLLDEPQELLLGELGRASRVFPALERALDEAEPIEVLLSTNEAYRFLREMKPLLAESGFGVESPSWWDSPIGRLGARLRIDSDPMDPMMEGLSGESAAPRLGLNALVGYHWDIAVGGTTLSLHEFERLASRKSPLVRIDGRWVEIRPEDVEAAVEFIRSNPGGEMELGEALRLAFGGDAKKIGLHVIGVEASGWVSSILGGEDSVRTTVPQLETPVAFHGTLRPYQLRGLSWLAFMERFGFGCCLADDMGLGKTVQLLALLMHERELAARTGDRVLPTLLIVPMSVVGNWMKETKRFAPELKVLVHHGLDRLTGDSLVEASTRHDTVVTTFALANRDRDALARVKWGRIVVDEAQFIKNPAAKQSQAVRSFEADRRIALTGTPVENRLSELWSIMEFLNPGFLGTGGDFRRRFSQPIERYRDASKSEQLRGLVRPFILRRVKTDPAVVADLPEKLETREYTHLTTEQAELYQACVSRMLGAVEQSEGIHRRGLVLAALIKLKQICNHPSQLLKDSVDGAAPNPARSGKCTRLLEMLDEVLAEGERALVFTQFRQMGHLLASMLRHELGREVLFLHGGTPQKAREKMVEQFQSNLVDTPILIVSLKAGGVGLNLTAATHVFHFDRWWNPAVENQATDRAYRIGQTRTVHVHKFVVRGTLEERVDEMIEAKTELAENIIGAGERWLTELDTSQLREILTLRAEAVGDEA
jgi:SNF2 family DNA or RNA helicase